MERLAERAVSVPRKRQIGQLRLDLVLRDAFVAGRAINLHPREFALLWRLAEVPGLPVRPDDLLCDVWRLSFRPETNTLAVHVSRLRAKLRLAGLDGIIETLPDGAYRIFVDLLPGASLPGGGMRSPNLALDAFLRLGKEQTTEPDNVKEQEHDHAA
ncbi:MAG: winged helix-turn-helix transcriptional regulator [Proteobacteria bacterium]|nr:winged helix-turn-helix transcriptional regulator [Pseudomonadota bacterium]